ncbi:MAG: hypothetical protein JXR83_20830 [Deltaproteobacteria bacterium]|nr:hypothetical protein [Deltaproteobacteria bacterium]
MAYSDGFKRATRDLVEHSAELIAAHSYDPLLGKAWIALFMSDAPQSSAQVAGFLGQPETAVADVLRQLTEMGLARASGDRYGTAADPLVAVSSFLRSRELPLLAETEESLRYACDELADDAAAEAKRACERLETLARQIGLLRGLLDRLTAGGALDLAKLVRALADARDPG